MLYTKQQLGVVFLEQGKASQALAYLDKALEFDPEHEQALLNSAILLQELGRAELRKIARERLLKLLAKDGKILSVSVFFVQDKQSFFPVLQKKTKEFISILACLRWTITKPRRQNIGSDVPYI